MSDVPITSAFPTHYWHSLGDGQIQCDLCPRYCKMHEGQRGLCFVRGVDKGRVVLTSYGRSSGFCVDPIEKKPFNHFLPGSPVLSFGTAGCNLACKFCQNWDISKSREFDTLADAASPETVADTARDLHCPSVAYTYNDPVIFMEYAIDVAKACRARGIKSVAVTAGYITEEPRQEFFAHMDAINVDFKGFSDTFYHKLCGAHLQPILDTLNYIKHETDAWLEITTLLIPGQNDGDAQLHAMAKWVAENLGVEVPWHFSAFYPAWKMLDTPATPPSTVQRACNIARGHGMRYVYCGNISDVDNDTTYCCRCHRPLIQRDYYNIESWNLDNNANCTHCGTPLPGVFEDHQGHWGRQRKVVHLEDYAQQ